MDNQEIKENQLNDRPTPPSNFKVRIGWIVAIIIIILAAGGFSYYQFVKIPDLKSQIKTLTSQVTDLKKQVSDIANKRSETAKTQSNQQ